ncbi:MAG: S-methyl-5-thioadenosine phosphorylase [Acidimicrobiales bacterium]|nr:S-methyl-5-thioadenosine phosphorylase [Acidimicrobiales bacterium]
MAEAGAEIGVFGGSGFYELLDDVTEVEVDTPYGAPSAKVHLGHAGGRRVAFLARHGAGHEIPAHRVNYRANVWALHSLGVRRLIGPCAVGSLQPRVRPGEFVVCDQLVDRTRNRSDTYFDGPVVNHISFADPYCPELRSIAVASGRAEGITVHPAGTVVVIEGPRFSTRAESTWFRSAGWEVVNMTQYPEAPLARELGMCYGNVSLVTDYDAGLEGFEGIEAVTMDAIFKVLEENIGHLRRLLFRAIPEIPLERSCSCGEGAVGLT